jgi:hypothetical protein
MEDNYNALFDNLPNLEYLFMEYSHVLAMVVGTKCPNLKHLKLNSLLVDDTQIENLVNTAKVLTKLQISEIGRLTSPGITPATLVKLREIPSVTTLYIDFTLLYPAAVTCQQLCQQLCQQPCTQTCEETCQQPCLNTCQQPCIMGALYNETKNDRITQLRIWVDDNRIRPGVQIDTSLKSLQKLFPSIKSVEHSYP